VRFPRSVVFMFDRSGSMTGDPIRYAKAALLNGLHMLGPEDKFTVVAFDHEQLWWTGGGTVKAGLLCCAGVGFQPPTCFGGL
jgi:hypothetical protein